MFMMNILYLAYFQIIVNVQNLCNSLHFNRGANTIDTMVRKAQRLDTEVTMKILEL